MQIKKILTIIEKQNNLKEFFSIFFSNFFAKYLSIVAIKLNIHPHLITFSMVPTSLIGFVLLHKNESNIDGMFVACLCYIILNIVDTSDGQVARFIKSISDDGRMLDLTAHFIADSLLILSIIFFILDYFGLNNYFIVVSSFFIFIQSLEFFFKQKKKKKFLNLAKYFMINNFLYFPKSMLTLNGFVHLYFIYYLFNIIFGTVISYHYFISIIFVYTIAIFLNKILKILTNLL